MLNNFGNCETRIIISDKKIYGSIEFGRFKYLTKLDCSQNQITLLANINKCIRLEMLDCTSNKIINLDNLPNKLKW